jgi:hypothetical protein
LTQRHKATPPQICKKRKGDQEIRGDKEIELIGKRQALKASSEIIFSENK